jgi:hypothetical protein
MRTRIQIAALVIAATMAYAMPCNADLLGTTVIGSLNFTSLTTNYFDPTNGFVPTMGFGNSDGDVTVTIADPGIEFAASFPANTDTADFTATQLILTDVVNSGSRDTPFAMAFTDSAFVGLGLTTVSDSFVNGGTTATLCDDTLTVSWDGGVVSPGTLQAIYSLDVATPEPSSWALLLAGVTILVLVRNPSNFRRRTIFVLPERRASPDAALSSGVHPPAADR